MARPPAVKTKRIFRRVMFDHQMFIFVLMLSSLRTHVCVAECMRSARVQAQVRRVSPLMHVAPPCSSHRRGPFPTGGAFCKPWPRHTDTVCVAEEPPQAAVRSGADKASKSTQGVACGHREPEQNRRLPIIDHIDLHVLIRSVCVRSALVNSLYLYNQILQHSDIH